MIKLLDENRAFVDISGVKKEIDISLVANIIEGDWVLVHTGFAISKVDEEKANAILAAYEEIQLA